MMPPGTVTADCIMARRPDGPVLWRSDTVQQPEQRGPPSLKSFLLGPSVRASASASVTESDPARDRDRGLYDLNGPPARWPCPVPGRGPGTVTVQQQLGPPNLKSS